MFHIGLLTLKYGVDTMKQYCLEISGRKHNCCEDSLFVRQFEDQNGQTIGVYVIGDGLSGYDGLQASHLAVKAVGEGIVQGILNQSYSVASQIIHDTIAAVNNGLSRLTRETKTTLDVVVATQASYPCIAHLGDGRIYALNDNGIEQQTKDENDGSFGPSNYLGVQSIYGKKIEDRINLRECSRVPKALFMTTDGLRSRVSNAFLEYTIHKNINNPQEILDILAQQVYVPSDLIRKLDPAKIDELAKMVDGLTKNDTLGSSDKIEKIIHMYKFQKSGPLVEAIDRLLPFDDVAMIYIDLEDHVPKQLNKLHLLLGDKSTWEREKSESNQLNRDRETDFQQLQRSLDKQKEQVQTLSDQNRSLTEEVQSYVTLNNERSEEISQLQIKIDHCDGEKISFLASLARCGSAITDYIGITKNKKYLSRRPTSASSEININSGDIKSDKPCDE